MDAQLQISKGGEGERILIVQTSFLGDVVLTTPLVSEIRRRFPKALVAILCTSSARGLLINNPHLDKIITDDKRGAGRGLRGLWRKGKELRDLGFTMALSPHKSLRSAMLLSLAGIPLRIGFRQSTGWYLYHQRVDRDAKCHDVERTLSLLKALGIKPEQCERRLRMEFDPATRVRVEGLFQSVGLERKEGRMIFGINPGSVWPTKRWSAEGYADLMVRLKKKYRCEIVLFGSPEDGEIVNRIQSLSGHAGVNLVGRTALSELACAVEWCNVFITNDSMPMHVAVARGVPVVAIFCSTTPSLGFYPYSSLAVVVEKNLPCRPCGSHGGLRCPLGTEDCIRLVSPEDVLRGIDRLLSRPVRTSNVRSSPMPEFISL